jgi:hypothetical protein
MRTIAQLQIEAFELERQLNWTNDEFLYNPYDPPVLELDPWLEPEDEQALHSSSGSSSTVSDRA